VINNIPYTIETSSSRFFERAKKHCRASRFSHVHYLYPGRLIPQVEKLDIRNQNELCRLTNVDNTRLRYITKHKLREHRCASNPPARPSTYHAIRYPPSLFRPTDRLILFVPRTLWCKMPWCTTLGIFSSTFLCHTFPHLCSCHEEN